MYMKTACNVQDFNRNLPWCPFSRESSQIYSHMHTNMIKNICKSLGKLQILYLSPHSVSLNGIPQLKKETEKSRMEGNGRQQWKKVWGGKKNCSSRSTPRIESLSKRVWMPKLKLKLNIITSFSFGMHIFVLSSTNAKSQGNLERLFNWNFINFVSRWKKPWLLKKCKQNILSMKIYF